MKIVMLRLNDMRADPRVDRAASALAAAGHTVWVLCLRGEGLPDLDVRSGYRIQRVVDASTSGWSRPWSKLRQNADRTQLLVKAACALDPDVVHANDSDTLVAASRTARRMGVRIVYEAHELFPDMIMADAARTGPMVQAYWRWLERRLVPSADAVITVGDALAVELNRRFGVNAVVVRSVLGMSPLLRSNRLRDEYSIDDSDVVLVSQGMLVAGRGTDRLVRAMQHVDGAVLILQGGGIEQQLAEQLVAHLGLQHRVVVAGQAPMEELHEYACSADVGVIMYLDRGLSYRLAEPNRLYAYMMAGLPIAATNLPGVARVVGGDELGLMFDPEDPVSIAEALNHLVSNAKLRREMGTRARFLAETKYNWDIEKRKLLDLYASLEAQTR